MASTLPPPSAIRPRGGPGDGLLRDSSYELAIFRTPDAADPMRGFEDVDDKLRQWLLQTA